MAAGPWVVNGRFLGAQVTGLQRTARSLLAAVREAGLDTEVVAPSSAHDPLVDRHLPTPPGRYGGQLFEQVLLPLAARGRPLLSLANTAPVLARRSVVVVHDLAPLAGPQWYVPAMRAYGSAVLASARRATRVVTVSHAMAGELAEAGVDPARIAVVANALDGTFHRVPRAQVDQVRRELGLTRPYALFVGWADPRKDLALAVAAHERVLASGREHDLVLVGRPHPTFAHVEVPTLPSVKRLGYVPEDQLVALLNGAACLLYPSRYEGFGLPPLEAWACGTPALVSDIPVLRESTGGRGPLLGRDVESWATALAASLDGRTEVPEVPSRSWHDAGRELLEVLRGVEG